MTKRFALIDAGFLATAFFLPTVPGCGGGSNLPNEVTVTLPDGTEVAVEEGAGAKSLSNTQWTFFRSAGNAQGAAFATIVFGENGNLERFEENKLAENIFGDEVVFDGTRRATKQAGLSYAAATYGAETSDASGFSFEGRFTAYFAGIAAGEAEASATGVYDESDPNIVRGTFHFVTRTTLVDIPGGNSEDTFDFVGERLDAE